MTVHRNLIGRLSVAAMVVAGILWLLFNRQRLEIEALVAWVSAFGMLAPLIFIAIRTLGAVILLPGSLMALTAGALFGPVEGAIYNLVASTLGAMLAFLVARYLASDFIAERLGDGRLARFVTGVETEGWRFVAFTRLVPLFPYNLLNYAYGLTRIKFSHYTIASLVCMIPGDVAYTYLGFAGRQAMAGNENSVEIGLIALGLLACMVFLPRLVRYFRKDPGQSGIRAANGTGRKGT